MNSINQSFIVIAIFTELKHVMQYRCIQ